MSEKIGKFILELRKEKNMTQQELASKLNVTDRAVSHWENGRSIPDVALFNSLCEIFDISVSELVNGKRKSKKNILFRKCFVFIFVLFISLLIIVVVNQNKKFEIYNFKFQRIDDDIYYKLINKMTIDDKNIYSYGLDHEQVCDKDEKCYLIYDALKNKKITLDDFKSYLDKQVEYQNYKITTLNDEGTTIYSKDGVMVIYCNTFENNHDVYIGNEKMLDNLNGEYCGFSLNNIVKNNFYLNELKDVFVSAVENSLTNASIKIQIYDKRSENYIYGSDYRIDKNINGKWEQLKEKESMNFDSMGYEPDINGMLYFNIDWYNYYGNLSKGKYRIVKFAYNKKDNDCDPDCKKYYYSVEFYVK